ncbi:MAG: hypothetical protein FWG16_05615 [Micrococcales bacterium]|nr:hypothetical protein [Micrococcales bacterium]
MNRFETLLAPPSLNSKDMRIHLRMHPEIPKDVSGRASQELVNVATRLSDELTTVRFGRDLATDQEPATYRQFCAMATGSTATPISYQFFATFFPADVSAINAAAWVDQQNDPVKVQAWAAQALRVATNSETEDPKNTATAWQRAMLLYGKFFELAQVEDTFTYRQQSDPQSQEACHQVWDKFQRDQVAALADRVQAYANAQQTEAFQATLAALSKPDVARINPSAAKRAKGEARDALTSGIDAATSLEAAEGLYLSQASTAEATDREALDRALLGAMTKEAALVEKGFGDLEALERCAEHVSLKTVDDSGVGSLTRAARHEFYEACANVARNATNNELSDAVKAEAARLLGLVPSGWVIGKGMVGQESITRDDVIEQLFFPTLGTKMQDLLKALMQAPANSEAEERALNDMLAFAKANPGFAGGPQTSKALLDACSTIFANSAKFSGAQPGSLGRRMMDAIAEFYPSDQLIEINDQKKTARDWIASYQSGQSGGGFEDLLARLASAPAASATEEQALDGVLSYARRGSLSDRQTEELKKCLLMIFGSSAAKYLENPKQNLRCIAMMRQIAGYLPNSTRMELGGQEMTLNDHVGLATGLVFFKQAQEASVGSVDERIAVMSMLHLLEEGIDFDFGGQPFRERVQSSLLNIGALNMSRGSDETARLIANGLGPAMRAKPARPSKPSRPSTAPKAAKPRRSKPAKARKVRRSRSRSRRRSGRGTKVLAGILVTVIMVAFFAGWIGLMYGAWVWTAALPSFVRVLAVVVAFFTPSILVGIYKKAKG